MTNNELKHIQETSQLLLEQQRFIPQELDYAILDRHTQNLQLLANFGNSIVSVFDMYKKEHVFYSYNVSTVLGYSSEDIEKLGNHFIDDKTHPDDYPGIVSNSLFALKLLMNLPIEEKMNYKLINEFRILNNVNQYIRVIEQQQVLEVDKSGNFWLSLSILDVSPNQNSNDETKGQLLNYRTGKFLTLSDKPENVTVNLTSREIEILKLVKNGFLSKEISDKLFISVHTVNTHRQRVLEKLEVSNSMEAVATASNLGLL